ncbi:MAG: TatD family hydrolase [Planctomycetes bacterium]|nr:TatD family hydrolase [Planctomycetota bacterium]
MPIVEPHIHMVTRTTDDYEALAASGVTVVIEPAFWLGEPRKRAATFLDYYDHLVGYETERAAAYGIEHYATISVNPREANREDLAAEVLREMPAWLSHPRVLGVGEIGFDLLTDAEERIFRRQVELAGEAGLPLLIHLPHRDKRRGTERTIEVLEALKWPPDRTLIDHNTEETIEVAAGWGAWTGYTIYPVTKLTPERALHLLERHGVERAMINSSADWGVSDPLSVPKTIHLLRRSGFAEDAIDRLVWRNPLEYYAQSGRIGPDGRPKGR